MISKSGFSIDINAAGGVEPGGWGSLCKNRAAIMARDLQPARIVPN